MNLTKKEVEHISHLARLGLTEKEKEKFRKQLSSILDYVKQLQEVDVSRVEPTAQVTGLENVMREDVVDGCDQETMNKLVAMAPEHEDGLIKTKSVFE